MGCSGSVEKESGERKARSRIPANLRNDVWKKYFKDNETGVCYCCGKVVLSIGWHCSHVIAVAKNGKDEISNLRVCCPKCNLSMGNQNMYTYIKNNNMQGPGRKAADSYLKKHPKYRTDRRTNNWGS